VLTGGLPAGQPVRSGPIVFRSKKITAAAVRVISPGAEVAGTPFELRLAGQRPVSILTAVRSFATIRFRELQWELMRVQFNRPIRLGADGLLFTVVKWQDKAAATVFVVTSGHEFGGKLTPRSNFPCSPKEFDQFTGLSQNVRSTLTH
jgi:hypothetical protein